MCLCLTLSRAKGDSRTLQISSEKAERQNQWPHIMPRLFPLRQDFHPLHNSSLQCTQPRNPGPGHPVNQGSMTAASWGNKFVFACPGEVTGLQGSHKKWGGSSEELSSSHSEVTGSRHPGSQKSK